MRFGVKDLGVFGVKDLGVFPGFRFLFQSFNFLVCSLRWFAMALFSASGPKQWRALYLDSVLRWKTAAPKILNISRASGGSSRRVGRGFRV